MRLNLYVLNGMRHNFSKRSHWDAQCDVKTWIFVADMKKNINLMSVIIKGNFVLKFSGIYRV